MRLCKCGAWIDGPAWKRVCKDCFINAKRREHSALVALCAQLDMENAELKRQLAMQRTLAPAMLVKLLHLCHPDHHDNSQLSNEVTRYLIELRRYADKEPST